MSSSTTPGSVCSGKFWEQPDDAQMQMVQLNIGALTQLTRLYLPDMIERRTGYILNVASTAAFQAVR